MEPLPCPEACVLLPPSHSRVSGGTARRAWGGRRCQLPSVQLGAMEEERCHGRHTEPKAKKRLVLIVLRRLMV